MGIFTPQNPVNDGGQSERLDDIKAHYASGDIDKEEYDDLMASEDVTSAYLRLKYAGLTVLLGTVGFFLIWSNL